jgi:hypothetical protein
MTVPSWACVVASGTKGSLARRAGRAWLVVAVYEQGTYVLSLPGPGLGTVEE